MVSFNPHQVLGAKNTHLCENKLYKGHKINYGESNLIRERRQQMRLKLYSSFIHLKGSQDLSSADLLSSESLPPEMALSQFKNCLQHKRTVHTSLLYVRACVFRIVK